MFQGQPTLALVVVRNLTAGGVSIYGTNPAPQQIFYVEQDPVTNKLLVLGDNAGPDGADEVALQPQESTQGLGLTWAKKRSVCCPGCPIWTAIAA